MRQKLLLLFVLMLSAQLSAMAWDGSGTEEDPYLIKTPEDMAVIAENVNDGVTLYEGEFFLVVNDLDFTGVTYPAIGWQSTYIAVDRPFNGTFDGGNHIISNYVSTHGGLFHLASGVVKNIILDTSCSINSSTTCGAIVDAGRVTIENCHSAASVNGKLYVGGIIGHARGDISNCSNTGDVTCVNGGYENFCGGIAGIVYGATITNCKNAGNVTMEGTSGYTLAAGGIAGTVNTINTIVKENYVEEGVVVKGKYAGAIAGCAYEDNGYTAASGDNFQNNYYECTVKVVSSDITYDVATPRGCGKTTGQTTPFDFTNNNGAMLRRYTIGDALVNSELLDAKEDVMVCVNVNRTFVAGNWNTVCLPFAVSGSEAKAKFGDNVQVMKLTGDSWDETEKRLTLEFTEQTDMEAGVPYLLKLGSSENVVNPGFDGVVLTKNAQTLTASHCDLTGIFDPTPFAANDKSVLFLKADKFYYPSVSSTMPALRAYFQLHDLDVSYARVLNMNFNGETTSIQLTGNDDATERGDCYDLQGRRVEGTPQRGIYVRNGRKVVVK